MRITPRYEGAAVINVDAVVRSPSAALVRQRARLAETLSGLTTGEWNTPSRCGGWTVQDVVGHLVGVNRFWSLSIQAGLRGEPTRLLASFDPVRVPAAMVQAARGASASATLDSFQATNAQLGTLVGSLTDADWDKLAEAPPGHLAIRAVALHALWDSWVHERDILIPLLRQQAVGTTQIRLAGALGKRLRLLPGEHHRLAGEVGLAGQPGGGVEAVEQVVERRAVGRHVRIVLRRLRVRQIVTAAIRQRLELPVALDELQDRDGLVLAIVADGEVPKWS